MAKKNSKTETTGATGETTTAKAAEFVSVSVSLPVALAGEVRGAQEKLLPGASLGLSETIRYFLNLGVKAAARGMHVGNLDSWTNGQ